MKKKKKEEKENTGNWKAHLCLSLWVHDIKYSPSQNLCRICSKYEMLKYESEWPNQANRSSSFMIPRAKGAQVNKQQEKKIYLGRHCYNLLQNMAVELLFKNWYMKLHFQARAPFLGISSADTAAV